MSEQIEYIDPREIKRDEYQPRLTFGGIDELAQSFDDDQQYDPVHIDKNNFLIDGERRWLASIKSGIPLKAIRHDVDTVEERDAIRDSLGEHKEEISTVERAWNYARRVAKINTGVDYTPQELQKMRMNDYELLKNSLATPTEWGNGERKTGGFSELARQLSKRSKKKFQTVTIREQTRIIFLSPKLLEKIDEGEMNLTYGSEIARLYETPTLMKKIEKEYLEGKFEKRDQVRARVTEYQKEFEHQVEEKASAIRDEQETPPSESPPVLPPPEIPEDVVSDKAKEVAAKPPKPQKTDREKAEGSLKAVESKIEKAEKAGVDVNEFSSRLETAKELLDSSLKESWGQAKILKKELDASLKEAKQSEDQRKAIEEAADKARKEAKAEADRKLAKEKERLALEAEAQKKQLEEARIKLEDERKRLAEQAEKELDDAKEALKGDIDFIKEVKREMQTPIPKSSTTEHPKRTIEEPKKLITFGVDTPLFLKLNAFTKKNSVLLEDAVIYLVKKGLEAEGFDF